MKPFSESGLILLYAVLLSCGYCCCCCAHRFSQQSALGFVQPSSVHHKSTFDTSHVTYTASCSSYTTNPAINRGRCNNIISGLYAKKKKNKGTGGKVMEEDVDELIEEEDGGVDVASVEALQANEEAVETTVTTTMEEEVGSDDNMEEEAKDGEEREEEESEEMQLDKQYMQLAINMATSGGGERGSHGPFPKPICGAVLVAKDGRILGQGRSNYAGHAVEFAFQAAGISATPLREWCVAWPTDGEFRRSIQESTLYVTLEPSNERQGTEKPPVTQLIEMANIPRLVIGCQDPTPDSSAAGAGALHASGVSVTMGVMQEECHHLIEGYTQLANSKMQRMARQHMKRFGRPMGHLHCSVIDSDDAEAFARNGNSFGKNFGGQHLSYRDFGMYEISPPPESIWADVDSGGDDDEFSSEIDDFFNMEFEDEDSQENLGENPMMPWYEQVDACVATFPRDGNGPVGDPSLQARLTGLKWLAMHGKSLPAAVDRVLVMDATDLKDLPIKNDPELLPGVDVEAFWAAKDRKPSRVLLRHGENSVAIAVAKAAAKAASAAAEASQKAKEAIETGDAELAAEAALQCQEAAMASNKFIQKEIQKTQELKQSLTDLGVKVEVLKGRDPIDVMKHLGKRSGYSSVVWRAGCWGNRGVDAILAGAFQRVSAHLAVDATGGKFWQLMLAERALQSACGPEREIKVFAEQDDINLEYCDREDADKDCALLFDGRPVRHVRLDARVAVIDEIKRKDARLAKTVSMKKFREEEAPWFL